MTIQAVVILTEPEQRSVQSNSTFQTAIMYEQKSITRVYKTSTLLYRSCAALAHFSGTFGLDIIEIKEKKNLFEAVNFEFMHKKVWFDRGLG